MIGNRFFTVFSVAGVVVSVKAFFEADFLPISGEMTDDNGKKASEGAPVYFSPAVVGTSPESQPGKRRETCGTGAAIAV